MNQSPSRHLFDEGQQLWSQGQCLYRVRELWQRAAELDPIWIPSAALINAILWHHKDALKYASMSSTALAMYVRAWALADTAMQRGGAFQQTQLWRHARSCLNSAESRYQRSRPTAQLCLARLYALGRLREFNQAFTFAGTLFKSWKWHDSRILLLKAAEKVLFDSGRKEAHYAVADLIYSQRDQYPLITSWVVFNQAFITRDLGLFQKALQLHNLVDHHGSCRQYCKYVSQIAKLCKDPIAYLNDAFAEFPDSADLLEARAALTDDPVSRFYDLQGAFDIDPSFPRANALLHAALDVDRADLNGILLAALKLHGSISSCDDCLFLELYADACCKLQRFAVALAANNRHIQLTMNRPAQDPERLSAFESRMHLFRQKFHSRSRDGWPEEHEPVNEEGWTKWTMAAAFGDAIHVSHDFVDHIDGGGRSPLFVACQRGNAKMVTALASFGATYVEYRDAAGRQPIETARMFLNRHDFELVFDGVKAGECIYQQRRLRYESELYQVFAEKGLYPAKDCFGLILQFLGPQYKIP